MTIDRHKIAAARLWAGAQFPYLASALFASPVVEVDDLEGVTVDEWWRVYADSHTIDEWSVAQIGAELIHHVGHLLRDHAARSRAVGVSSEEIFHWVDSADAEINDDLPVEVLPHADPVLPADLGGQPGRFAEEYLRTGLVRHGEGHDCGSGAHGDPRPWDRPPPSGDDGVDADQSDLLRRQVAAEVLRHAGEVPGGVRRWAEALLESRVDWRAALAAELRRGVAEVVGAVDYTYSRPSRRASAVRDVVLPAMRRPVPEIAVVCDTSGSMSEDALAAALAEVDGLVRTVGVRGLRVFAVDDAVRGVQRVTVASAVELLGGGGTDMGTGLRAAVESRPPPHVVVVLTDGFTPWPAERPGTARVVVGLLAGGGERPPEWARTIRIGEPA